MPKSYFPPLLCCPRSQRRVAMKLSHSNACPLWLLYASITATHLISRGDPGADMGQAPAISPLALDQHFSSHPPSGLNMMGVYATNFNETPYCCPWNPKAFELASPSTAGWGVVPIICQIADSGQNGMFDRRGTVLVGQSFLLPNGSVAYFGHGGSQNGAYYFGFALDETFKNVCLAPDVTSHCHCKHGLTAGFERTELISDGNTGKWLLHFPARTRFDRGWRRPHWSLGLDISARTYRGRMLFRFAADA